MQGDTRSAESEFLKEIGGSPSVANVLDNQPPLQPKTEEKEEEQPKDNREVRRLRERLDRSEKAQIELNERVKVLSELGVETKKAEGSDIDPRLVAAFGTSEEGKAASKLLADMLEDNAKKAEERAVSRLREERDALKAEDTKESNYLDQRFEAIEDKYGVDLTSNTKAAKELNNQYVELLEKFSPKDENGNITQYADFESVFEILKESSQRNPETTRRQKEFASRSMTSTNQSANSAPKAPKRVSFRDAERFIDSLRGR